MAASCLPGLWLAIVLVGAVWSGLAGASDQVLTVHEWGTFTSLQDERGEELSGINTDDEPVPEFVHNLNRFLLSKPLLSSAHWRYRQKGAPRMHPLVTMRLETPVIYFYPPRDWPAGKAINVEVSFRGGWLTEFYPQAKAEAPGLTQGLFDFGALTKETTGKLEWNNLKIGASGSGPETDQPVWLAPRHVKAANLTSEGGEGERYLFYRGIGRLRAPLRALIDRQAGQLTVHANFDEVLRGERTERIPAIWLVEVREGGHCAWRALGEVNVSDDRAAQLLKSSYRFEPSDFTTQNQPSLQQAMREALVADGLSPDEAGALLTTWKNSYFLSPGLRLFYLVPRAWTDHYLPLSVSAKAKIERVMVGRLELISDERRALLDRLARAVNSDGKWVEKIPESPARDRFLSGRSDFGELGVPIPGDYQLYLALGRFRNALVVHEERARPTPNLTRFINAYALHPFRVPPTAEAPKTSDLTAVRETKQP